MTQHNTSIENMKDIVLSFIQAINAEDFDTAKEYLNDDFQFIGVLGSRDGAEAYISDMKKMKFKYDILKIFSDDNDICLFYDIDMGKSKTIFASGWYKLEGNKISTFKVVFDPRPVLS